MVALALHDVEALYVHACLLEPLGYLRQGARLVREPEKQRVVRDRLEAGVRQNSHGIIVGIGCQGDDALGLESLSADGLYVDPCIGQRPADVGEHSHFVLGHDDNSVHPAVLYSDSFFRQSSTTASIVALVT